MSLFFFFWKNNEIKLGFVYDLELKVNLLCNMLYAADTKFRLIPLNSLQDKVRSVGHGTLYMRWKKEIVQKCFFNRVRRQHSQNFDRETRWKAATCMMWYGRLTLRHKVVRIGVDGSGSGSCQIAGLAISGVERSGSVTRELVFQSRWERSFTVFCPFSAVLTIRTVPS